MDESAVLHVNQNIFISVPESKAQVSFSDRNLSAVRHRHHCRQLFIIFVFFSRTTGDHLCKYCYCYMDREMTKLYVESLFIMENNYFSMEPVQKQSVSWLEYF